MNTTFHSSNLSDEGDFFSIKLPEYRKPKLELWAFMPLNDLEVLLSVFDSTEFMKSKDSNRTTEYKKFKSLIARQLNLKENSKQDQILIDKYYYIIRFGIENNFSTEQINSLLLVVKRTHELAMETSFGNLDETFDYFKRLVVMHSVHRPPYSVSVFSLQEVDLIIAYVFDIYFKQFKFYKYVFSQAVRLDVKLKYSNLPEDKPDIIETSIVNNDFLAELESENKTIDSHGQSTAREDIDTKVNEGQHELKEFIRNYLSDKLKKMKDELSNELTPSKTNDKNPTKKK